MSKKPTGRSDHAPSTGHKIPDLPRISRRDKQSSNDRRPIVSLLMRRSTGIVLSLALVAALQLSMTWDKLTLPFLDTQLHYSFDNALFSTYARNGNRLGDLRSQFGITSVPYVRWGERSGPASYYTHHPFLFKALFQQYAKIFGDAEWVSRSFYLLLSFGIASGFYAIVLLATGSLATALGGTVLLVHIPLFALFQTCVKYEIDGMLVGTWLFAAAAGFIKSRRTALLVAVAILGTLAPLTSWSAIFLAASTILWLAGKRIFAKDRAAGLAAATAAFGILLGSVALITLLTWIKGSWNDFRADILSAYAVRTDNTKITARAWLDRQAAFAEINFGGVLLWILTLITIALCMLRIQKHTKGNRHIPKEPSAILSPFLVCSMAAAAGWILGFTQGSFIHNFYQYGFLLPAAILPAVALERARNSRTIFIAGLAGAFFLAIYLRYFSAGMYTELLAQQRGTVEEINLLRSLQQDRFTRMVFVPLVSHPFSEWFQGPLFEYYTDRPVVSFDGKDDPKSGDKILLLRYTQQAQILPQVEEHFGIRLSGEKCSSRICAYDVLER
jgi:hypothetical protein